MTRQPLDYPYEFTVPDPAEAARISARLVRACGIGLVTGFIAGVAATSLAWWLL